MPTQVCLLYHIIEYTCPVYSSCPVSVTVWHSVQIKRGGHRNHALCYSLKI